MKPEITTIIKNPSFFFTKKHDLFGMFNWFLKIYIHLDWENVCKQFFGVLIHLKNHISHLMNSKIFQHNRINTTQNSHHRNQGKNINKLIWLDDFINPLDPRMDWLAFSPIGRDVEVIWIKNKNQFKTWIAENGLPAGICFDLDLGDHGNCGYECAEWLMNYCHKMNLKYPSWASHSTNTGEKAKFKRFLREKLKSDYSTKI